MTRATLIGIATAAVVTAAVVLYAAPLQAQGPQRQRGPVIDGYGGTFDVPAGSLMPRLDLDYRVAFDVGTAADDPKAVNPKIDAVARFLNMHARAGVPRERLQAALVIHSPGAKDAIDHSAYRERFGVDNPNLPLLEALAAAGVRIYVCGQSLASRGFGFAHVGAPVTVALSAMTAHHLLRAEGYAVNPF
ncbi:MAG: DsrE family protein [Acidobacteriota bacterium]